jgi:predicted nucleic acid-binding protein
VIVVSDTSPVTALLTIGEVELLQRLFTEVVIPSAVRDELLRSHPGIPAWITIASLKDRRPANEYSREVDSGEAEAIALARELGADRLLIDERRGRRLAIREGVAVIGLVGVILLARNRNLIQSARTFLSRLQTEAGVYLSPEVRDAALATVGE